MFENMTYEALVKRALARVPPTMDKREGSMVFLSLIHISEPTRL